MINHRQANVATATNYYHQHQPQHLPHTQLYHDPAHASLAYRPLQLPLQHQHQHQTASPAAEHQQTQTQLSLAAAGAGYQHQSFRHHHPSSLPHRSRPQPRQEQPRTMSQGSHQMSEEELAQFQQASNEYEAPITGPLVGQRQPSTAITTEYASADPVYQAKTQALPQKYSYYRTVRGDGKCGWRAVAFGYFEALIHHGDSNRFGMEEARLRSLGNVVSQAGFSMMVYDDFADETYALLRVVANALNDGHDAAVAVLLDKFNDSTIQDYIISHLRTLTAAWMKTHHADYAGWLLQQTVDEFCQESILPILAEIEHVGLSALKDVLLAPAAIRLEVMYLDRSEGDQVTMHRFDPVTGGGYTIGTVRLLYRPGHYDLLYKPEDLPAPPPPAPVPTYLQFGTQTHQEPAYDLGVSAIPDFMMTIPGMSYASQPQQAWGMPSSYATDFTFSAPAPVTTCTPAVHTPSAPAPQPQAIQSQPVYVSGGTPPQMVPPPTQLTHEMAIRPAAMAHLAHHDVQSQLGNGPFRMSTWNYDADFMQATSQLPFQTSIFRNSHYNQAHFLNPDFQPEQWDPEGEYTTAGSSSSKSSRHKTCG